MLVGLLLNSCLVSRYDEKSVHRTQMLMTAIANMTNTSSLLTSLDQGVYTLTLNRPEQRNALDVPMLEALAHALEEARTNAAVRCVVVAARGKGFCAGADVVEWAQAQADGRLETYGWTQAAHGVMLALYSLPKPTLAVIQGSAVGAGLDLALCCDLRVSAQAARFRAGYTGMAYAPDAGASWHLPRLVGAEQARRFLFLNAVWDAAQALQAGLVGEVVDDAALADHAQALAAQLASGPTLAFGYTKALLQNSSQQSLAQQLKAEHLAGLACGRTEDAAEALRASMEKRAPIFAGK